MTCSVSAATYIKELQLALAAANARADAAEFSASVLPAEAQHAISELTEALAAARRECEGLRVERDHLRAATANANKQTADLNALRLKQDAELQRFRDAMSRVRDRSNHGDFYEAMKIADAVLTAPSSEAEK